MISWESHKRIKKLCKENFTYTFLSPFNGEFEKKICLRYDFGFYSQKKDGIQCKLCKESFASKSFKPFKRRI